VSTRRASLEDVAELIAPGGVVALTGAGISAESGIPTFRDPGGLWDRFDPEEFGTWEGLARTALARPDDLARFLSALRQALDRARPGPGHLALAHLEAGGIVERVVTQNVDALHQEAGSHQVVELHGSFRRRACLACGRREGIGRRELLDDLDRAIAGLRSAFVPSLAAVLPRCSACGGPARPDFVAFGEPVQAYEDAERLVRASRVLLVIGTSGEVFPAASLPGEARSAGATVVEVAPGPTQVEADLRLEGQAGAVLTSLTELVGTRSGR
jgi:NAD-dependent protein deacetylase/lipoamidase